MQAIIAVHAQNLRHHVAIQLLLTNTRHTQRKHSVAYAHLHEMVKF